MLIRPEQVVLEDGSRVTLARGDGGDAPPSWWQDARGILSMFQSRTMLLLAPLFLASNWFYSYQFNAVNAHLFNVRTRGFNNIVYWSAQMLGAYVFGAVLDGRGANWLRVMSRSARARLTLGALMCAFCAVWGGGLALQLTYTRQSAPRGWDVADSTHVAGPITLYALYGALDAALQTWCYWIMSADATVSVRDLAFRAGFYKGVQSVGGALSWAIDAADVAYVVQLIVCWALLLVGAPGAWHVAGQVKAAEQEQQQQKEPEQDSKRALPQQEPKAADDDALSPA